MLKRKEKCCKSLSLKFNGVGLPWWRSGWESACWCRGRGFEPWSGRIPRAVEQLGPWATTTEPARLEPVLRNERGRDSERPAHRDEEWPPLATTRESPRTEMKTQHSHKKKKKKMCVYKLSNQNTETVRLDWCSRPNSMQSFLKTSLNINTQKNKTQMDGKWYTMLTLIKRKLKLLYSYKAR